MVDRAHALLAGAFVLVLAVIAIGFAILFGGNDEDGVPYLIVSEQPVAGLQIHSDVSYRGVSAGSVRDIRIDETNPRNVLVLINIRPRIPITKSTFARLDRKLVTGNADVVLNDDWQSDDELPTSEQDPGRIPMRPSLVGEITEVLPRVLERLETVAERMQSIIPPDAGKNLDKLLAGLATGAQMLPELERELGAAVRAMRPLGREARGTLKRVDALLTDLQGTSKSLEKLAAVAAELSASGAQASEELVDETVPRANAALAELAEMAASVERLAQALRDSPQSLVRGRPQPSPGPGEKGY